MQEPALAPNMLISVAGCWFQPRVQEHAVLQCSALIVLMCVLFFVGVKHSVEQSQSCCKEMCSSLRGKMGEKGKLPEHVCCIRACVSVWRRMWLKIHCVCRAGSEQMTHDHKTQPGDSTWCASLNKEGPSVCVYVCVSV